MRSTDRQASGPLAWRLDDHRSLVWRSRADSGPGPKSHRHRATSARPHRGHPENADLRADGGRHRRAIANARNRARRLLRVQHGGDHDSPDGGPSSAAGTQAGSRCRRLPQRRVCAERRRYPRKSSGPRRADWVPTSMFSRTVPGRCDVRASLASVPISRSGEQQCRERRRSSAPEVACECAI